MPEIQGQAFRLGLGRLLLSASLPVCPRYSQTVIEITLWTRNAKVVLEVSNTAQPLVPLVFTEALAFLLWLVC